MHIYVDADALPGTAYAAALKAWARANWHHLTPFARLPAHAPWPSCPRDGALRAYSLLGDLAASIGEAIRRAVKVILIGAGHRQDVPDRRTAGVQSDGLAAGPFGFGRLADLLQRACEAHPDAGGVGL